jgi:hypothetical protein
VVLVVRQSVLRNWSWLSNGPTSSGYWGLWAALDSTCASGRTWRGALR